MLIEFMIAKKSLGQHFLICNWVADALIAAAELTKNDVVLEIGPGAGALTRPLAAASKRVIAVEKDGQLALTLRGALKKEGGTNVKIVTADILKVLPHLPAVYNLQTTGYKLVANIPYYLTGRLLRLIFETESLPKSVALTVQKEVAERIVAKPPHMNMLALSVQVFGKPEITKAVPAFCFSPKPEVDSAIIKISDISADFFRKHMLDRSVFFPIIRAAFGQKRKQLVNTLAGATGDKKKTLEILHAADINHTSRPEELTLYQWAALCRAIIIGG